MKKNKKNIFPSTLSSTLIYFFHLRPPPKSVPLGLVKYKLCQDLKTIVVSYEIQAFMVQGLLSTPEKTRLCVHNNVQTLLQNFSKKFTTPGN